MMQTRLLKSYILRTVGPQRRNAKRGLTDCTKGLLLSSNGPRFHPHQHASSRNSTFLQSTACRSTSSSFINSSFHPGPPLRLGTGRIANLTASSVVGTCGNTVVLAAVAADTASDQQFLTVDYRQRAAAVGTFPQQNARRTDSGRPTDSEILSGRAIDRALRPLLASYHPVDGTVAHYHVQVTVQAAEAGSNSVVATALNTAVAAVAHVLRRPLAATVLSLRTDGTVVQHTSRDDHDDGDEVQPPGIVGELLYAGTRERAVMMEWTSFGVALPEADLQRLLELAHAAIQPAIDTIAELQKLREESEPQMMMDEEGKEALRQSLGLAQSVTTDEDAASAQTTTEAGEWTGVESSSPDSSSDKPTTMLELMEYREKLLQEVVTSARDSLGSSLHRLFGYSPESNATKDCSFDPIHVHNASEEPLLSKRYRGQREQVMQEEIQRLVDDHLDKKGIQFLAAEEGAEDLSTESQSLHLNDSDRTWIREQAVYKLLRRALWETTTQYGTRSDSRSGLSAGQAWKTIRPLTMTVPVLPDAVHGSALFARGDTQVICTTTLGAPRDGPPLTDPFVPTPSSQMIDPSQNIDENDPAQLPVGSLRFLRTQEAMESDLNSRKVRADRERTGDSGSLAEKKRAFLQYDFPSYSTGVISTRKGGIDRRAVGHGSLAERAVLPLLPDAETFPYSIRMTSEVTDSNGSSSMASVCGATLALLDAGVPMQETVAGVSVGLAVKQDDVEYNADSPEAEQDEFSLLLDITGTEDHVRVFLGPHTHCLY